jgi:hypothetical protein
LDIASPKCYVMVAHTTLNKMADIWSLGCILHVLCLGTPVFKTNFEAVLYADKEKGLEVLHPFTIHSKVRSAWTSLYALNLIVMTAPELNFEGVKPGIPVGNLLNG